MPTLHSLSADTKDALARDIPAAAHCREALLEGLALYGTRVIRGSDYFVTHRNAIARLYRTLSSFDSPSTSLRTPALRASGLLRMTSALRIAKSSAYRIAIPETLRGLPPKPLRRCDRVMEARAAFLVCGSLSAGVQGYHLEFVPPDAERAARLNWMLRAVADPPKRMKRKRQNVLYYKDFEAIVALLGTIGAHAAVLQLEDLHALKETKNRIHRLVNTEAANLERTANAAAAQRDTIEFVTSAYGLAHLSRPLREIAELRLQHPGESLAELGRRCNPRIGKPTVNSRLSALTRLARRLRGETPSR